MYWQKLEISLEWNSMFVIMCLNDIDRVFLRILLFWKRRIEKITDYEGLFPQVVLKDSIIGIYWIWRSTKDIQCHILGQGRIL